MRAAPLIVACLLAFSACGSDQEPRQRADRPDRSPERQNDPPPSIREAHCPAGATNCESATGTVIYVEAVDPDGDGDAHFVLSSDESITGPGISVIDVPRDLRPDPLPQAGDLVTAAGPVYPGSYGQAQIQAEVVRVAD